jgi:hypothetical protein
MSQSLEASESRLNNITKSKSKTDGLFDLNGRIGAIVVASFWLALYVTAIVNSLAPNGRNSTKSVTAITDPTTDFTEDPREEMRVFDKRPQE